MYRIKYIIILGNNVLGNPVYPTSQTHLYTIILTMRRKLPGKTRISKAPFPQIFHWQKLQIHKLERWQSLTKTSWQDCKTNVDFVPILDQGQQALTMVTGDRILLRPSVIYQPYVISITSAKNLILSNNGCILMNNKIPEMMQSLWIPHFPSVLHQSFG